jgi:hypothetical protein
MIVLSVWPLKGSDMPEDKVLAVEASEFHTSAFSYTLYYSPPGGPPSGSASSLGHGHLQEGYVAPDPGSTVTYPSRGALPPVPNSPEADALPPAAPQSFIAYCFAEHEQGSPGVDKNGNWSSGFVARCEDAVAAANGHEHLVDRIEAVGGPVGVPIPGC